MATKKGVSKLSKTFEAAHKIFLTLQFKDPMYRILQQRKVSEMTAYDKLMIWYRVLQVQLEFEPDYSNRNQEKWFAVFYYADAKTGFVLSDSGTFCVITYAAVCSRLCLPTDEAITWASKHKPLLKLHNEYLLIQQ